MQTFTIQITDENGLRELRSLEEKKMIRILKNEIPKSYVLPGPKMNLKEFRKWIKDAERSPTITLEEAKEKWNMAHIKEPGVDFIINSRPLTPEEEIAISNHIKNYKLKHKTVSNKTKKSLTKKKV